MKIEDLLHQTRGTLAPEEAFSLLIEVAAKMKQGNFALENLREPHMARAAGLLPALEGSAKILLSADPDVRLSVIAKFMTMGNRVQDQLGVIQGDAADQLLDLIDGAESVRFSFGPSLFSCLIYGRRLVAAGKSPKLTFCSFVQNECRFMEDAAQVLDLEEVISVECKFPWARESLSEAAVEVMMPPFGLHIRDIAEVPARTLALLGIDEGRAARVNGETVSIADALENTRARVIIAVSEGELFRMVGAEPVARRALIESGRLKAVLGVPSGMMFANTFIKTSLIVMSPSLSTSNEVRFIDLGHEALSQKGRRGRAEILKGTSWRDAIKAPVSDDRSLARDVTHDEIKENKFVLVSDRYLNIGTREQIDALLAQSDVAPLEDIVELVRSVTIPADNDGEYGLLEAAPSDVNARGYVGEPKREITVDRAKYNKACKQQIRPGDVLLSIKGTVGVVALVPDDVPGEGARRIWTAGQAMMILRPKARVKMSSLALYEYLSNETVQEYIKSIAGGAAVQTIAMKDLKGFAIPMPDEETVAALEENFAERQKIFDEIDALKMKLEDVRGRGWPHLQLRAQS
ncbi:N-6 DNA methylase [Donghicola eburneus]|uniref:Type I restriction modification DNA specificity domain-containing protein n=1 Tax=Donghicola eburneus TaxID=393278 RepID=A0A1M4N6L3_9RHOB|nr:N-6 DNA methylase [Donghicola eburneus]SCM68736.1 hypothetical protein KARMA_2963 [Donghicola eburneus]